MKNIHNIKLRYSNNTMVIVTLDNIHYKYFSSNEYGGVCKAREAARLYLKAKQEEHTKQF